MLQIYCIECLQEKRNFIVERLATYEYREVESTNILYNDCYHSDTFKASTYLDCLKLYLSFLLLCLKSIVNLFQDTQSYHAGVKVLYLAVELVVITLIPFR